MATLALTATPAAFSLMPGTPVWFTNTNAGTATISFAFTSAGAGTNPVPIAAPLAASTGTLAWTWPGIFIFFGTSTLYLVASVASGVTLFYPT